MKDFYQQIDGIKYARSNNSAEDAEELVCSQLEPSAEKEIARVFEGGQRTSLEVGCGLGICIAAHNGAFGTPGPITADDFYGQSPNRMEFIAYHGATIQIDKYGEIAHFDFLPTTSRAASPQTLNRC